MLFSLLFLCDRIWVKGLWNQQWWEDVASGVTLFVFLVHFGPNTQQTAKSLSQRTVHTNCFTTRNQSQRTPHRGSGLADRMNPRAFIPDVTRVQTSAKFEQPTFPEHYFFALSWGLIFWHAVDYLVGVRTGHCRACKKVRWCAGLSCLGCPTRLSLATMRTNKHAFMSNHILGSLQTRTSKSNHGPMLANWSEIHEKKPWNLHHCFE